VEALKDNEANQQPGEARNLTLRTIVEYDWQTCRPQEGSFSDMVRNETEGFCER
jgi:hypothetical protein